MAVLDEGCDGGVIGRDIGGVPVDCHEGAGGQVAIERLQRHGLRHGEGITVRERDGAERGVECQE